MNAEEYSMAEPAQETMTEAEREGLQIAGFLEEALLSLQRLGLGKRRYRDVTFLTPEMRSLAFSTATAALTEAQHRLRRLGEIEGLMVVGVEPVKSRR